MHDDTVKALVGMKTWNEWDSRDCLDMGSEFCIMLSIHDAVGWRWSGGGSIEAPLDITGSGR
jgi:hypothetical protein